MGDLAALSSSSSHNENNNRLSDTIHSETSCNLQAEQRVVYHSLDRDESTDSENDSGRSVTGSKSWRRIHLSSISGSKTRPVFQTCIQPKKFELFRRGPKVSSDQHAPCSSIPSITKLDGETGHIPSVLSCTDSTTASALPEAYLREPGTRNDLPSIRAIECSSNVCHTLKLDGTETSEHRNKSDCLPRRFSFCRSRRFPAHKTNKYGKLIPRIPGLGYKQGKIIEQTTSEIRISRDYMGHTVQFKNSSREEDIYCPKTSHSSHLQELLGDSRDSEVSRNSKLCQFRNTLRSPKYAQLTKTIICPTEGQGYTIPPSRSPPGHALVVESSDSQEQNMARPSFSFHCNRRLGYRLGRLYRRCTLGRSMEFGGSFTSLERERTDDYLLRDQGIPARFDEFYGASSERQPNSCCLLEKTRRNSIPASVQSHTQDIPYRSSKKHSADGELYSRTSQHDSRQLVQKQNTGRVASPASSDSSYLLHMGLPANRPDGVELRPRSPSVRILGHQGQKGSLHRCIQQDLALPTSVDISSSESDAPSPSCSKSSVRDLHNHMPQVEERLLENRTEETIYGSTLHHKISKASASRHANRSTTTVRPSAGIGSMEMSGWEDLTKDWTTTQKSILEAGWRSSTLKTYKSAWDRWCAWCHQTDVSPKNPSPDILAKYLIHLHCNEKLAYRTILTHKSVISRFGSPASESDLGSHILVKQTLKGIANKSIKHQKPPIWNPQVLVSYLLNEQSPTESLFNASRRCAILLLLASGRRVHDLTLLSIADDKCIIDSDTITFWPEYGSKTDTPNYQQSGWQLLSGLEENIDPVFWIKKVLSLSASRRREAGGIFNLFLTTTGAAKAASRTIIAGWVRTILKDAGIDSSAGSIRSAVASLNWVESFTIEDILARGNWRSSNTLLTFYRKPLLQPPNSSTPSVATYFKPVNN